MNWCAYTHKPNATYKSFMKGGKGFVGLEFFKEGERFDYEEYYCCPE